MAVTKNEHIQLTVIDVSDDGTSILAELKFLIAGCWEHTNGFAPVPRQVKGLDYTPGNGEARYKMVELLDEIDIKTWKKLCEGDTFTVTYQKYKEVVGDSCLPDGLEVKPDDMVEITVHGEVTRMPIVEVYLVRGKIAWQIGDDIIVLSRSQLKQLQRVIA